ncbi:MAG TPA: glycosyltransferase family 2 protein [Burkholderiaceae bacterium]|nr:glycosyltransferase family 2 protein [Burkholderiaceae bacterium]
MSPPVCRIGVVLLNFNGWRDTVACLRSLLAMTLKADYLVVCDNASTDGSFERLCWTVDGLPGSPGRRRVVEQAQAAELAPQSGITLIRNADNLGFAAGNNVGIRHLLGDPALTHVWILNNDTEVDADALSALARASCARPEVGIWGATVLDHRDRTRVQALGGGAFDPWTGSTRHLGAFGRFPPGLQEPEQAARIEHELRYVLGASMFVTRGWLQQVGLLDERYFLYYEELDWAFRGGRRFALGYAPQARVFHREGATAGTSPTGGSPLSVFHLHRSKLLFCRRHLPRYRLPTIVVASAWQSLKFLLRRRPALALSTLRGMLSGLFARAPGSVSWKPES